MRVLKNNYRKSDKARQIWCTKCHSELEITDAEIPAGGMVKCPACKQDFKAMTSSEEVNAYYTK